MTECYDPREDPNYDPREDYDWLARPFPEPITCAHQNWPQHGEPRTEVAIVATSVTNEEALDKYDAGQLDTGNAFGRFAGRPIERRATDEGEDWEHTQYRLTCPTCSQERRWVGSTLSDAVDHLRRQGVNEVDFWTLERVVQIMRS